MILERYAEVYSDLINSRLERAHSSQYSAVQCSTIKSYKFANQQMIPFPQKRMSSIQNEIILSCFPITRNSSRARQPLWVSRENVTGLLHWLQDFFQIKIENICLFKLIKKHGKVFKKWLCPNFLLPPKKSELPKIWGGCSPPRPPGPYAYVNKSYCTGCTRLKLALHARDLRRVLPYPAEGTGQICIIIFFLSGIGKLPWNGFLQ